MNKNIPPIIKIAILMNFGKAPLSSFSVIDGLPLLALASLIASFVQDSK